MQSEYDADLKSLWMFFTINEIINKTVALQEEKLRQWKELCGVRR